MRPSRRSAAVALVWVSRAAGSGCTDPRLATRKPWPPGADTLRTADSATQALNAARQPGALATVAAQPVERWMGPGTRPFEVATRTAELEAGHARRFGSITLQTTLRVRNLDQYPCTSCHLGRKIVMTEKRVGDAHQNIEPVHPKQTGALCPTCHAPENVELLALEDGKRATLDATYQLCAQCHFAQVDSWAAGAHGKRLDGWQGRRVVMGCADCHDPHRPAPAPRTPFRPPQLTQARGQHP